MNLVLPPSNRGFSAGQWQISFIWGLPRIEKLEWILCADELVRVEGVRLDVLAGLPEE